MALCARLQKQSPQGRWRNLWDSHVEKHRKGSFGAPSFWGSLGSIAVTFVSFGVPLGDLEGPPRGPKMGPGTPGIDLKSKKKIQKFGPEVSTIFEILIFGFLGVFLITKASSEGASAGVSASAGISSFGGGKRPGPPISF